MKKEILLNSNDVHHVLRALPFCGTDTLRPILTGITFVNDGKNCKLYASDAHRLYKVVLPTETMSEPFTITLPAKEIKQLVKNDLFHLQVNESGATLNGQPVNPIEGTPINFESFIPTEHYHIYDVHHATFERLITGLAKLANQVSHQVTFTFDPSGTITIQTCDIDYSHEFKGTMAGVHVSGDQPFTIAFNANLLAECVKALKVSGKKDDYIRLKMSTPTRALILAWDPNYSNQPTVLLMPLMIG